MTDIKNYIISIQIKKYIINNQIIIINEYLVFFYKQNLQILRFYEAT